MKTCKTCTHYRPSWPFYSKCAKYDLFAENARKFSTACGPDGIGYNPISPKPSIWTRFTNYLAEAGKWQNPFG